MTAMSLLNCDTPSSPLSPAILSFISSMQSKGVYTVAARALYLEYLSSDGCLLWLLFNGNTSGSELDGDIRAYIRDQCGLNEEVTVQMS